MTKEEFKKLVDITGMLNDKINKNKKNLDQNKTKIKDNMNKFGNIHKEESLVFESDGYTATSTTKPRYDIAPEKVWEFVDKDIDKFLEVVNINTKALEDNYGKNTVIDMKEKVGESTSISFKKKG